MENKNTFLILKIILIAFLTFQFSLLTYNCLAQSGGVAINATGSIADNSAMLDISSTNQGMRIPRVALTSTSSSAPITNPANSLLVYDSVSTGDVTPGFYYWDVNKWVKLATGSGGWSTSGNSGTDTTINFIGTTDAQSWVMKTDNTERMKISKTGNVGIGTPNPASSAILDISSTTKGMRMPNMTTIQRDAISSPVIGLQIFNTDCGGVDYYNGSCWISMSKSVLSPGPISTDTTSFCTQTTHTYSIAPVPTANTYTWAVPAGSKILSGQGSTSVIVIFGSISGNVCVDASNNCETSPARCIEVNVSSAPITPGNITGPITAVPGQTNPVSYSIASITGANNYNWTVPPGASIISGQGTTNIVVNYSCNTTAGYVSVTQTAACGTSSPASSSITVNPLLVGAGPAKNGPGAIGGYPTASGGTGTGSYLYSWSPSTGLTSTTIANPTANACFTTTYIVTVTDANACTATSSVIVNKNLTANAGTNVNTIACPNTTTIGPAVGTGGNGSYTYSWSPTAGMSGATTSTPTPPCGTPTTYTVTITDGVGCTATSSMNFTVGMAPSPSTLTLNYTGSTISWTVPAGVSSITIEAWGAQGGAGRNAGGLGGYSKGTKATTAGTVFLINAGGQNGWNGGGSGGAGVGGGASDVRTSGGALTDRIIVAGGGGGSGSGGSCGTRGSGGNAGNLGGDGGGNGCCGGGCGTGGGGGGGAIAGANGAAGEGSGSGSGGAGGTGSATGGNPGGNGASCGGAAATAGTLGQGGIGSGSGGGGGAGYYGGGGGGAGCSYLGSGGGGSGSNYTYSLTGASTSDGVQSGNGKVLISW